MKVVVLPYVTTRDAGEMVPPAPAVAETVYELAEKVALTVHAPVMTPVVYVVPESEPPQPEAEAV